MFSDIKGAIFDLDDTLLDNGPTDEPAKWLHSVSRLAAVHEVGNAHGIKELVEVTDEENGRAFTTAAEHSLTGAIWNIFFMKGLVASNTPDLKSPLALLVKKIAERKNALHETVLRTYGLEIPGASKFVKLLSANGLSDHLALATSAIERDINIFLDKYNLQAQFPPERIISAEKVTRPKPDPECFELAFNTLGLPDSDRRYVVAFEDNPRGIQSAKGAGLFVCAITTRLDGNSPELLAANPDLIANSYAEFSELLGVPTLRSILL